MARHTAVFVAGRWNTSVIAVGRCAHCTESPGRTPVYTLRGSRAHELTQSILPLSIARGDDICVKAAPR